jgi:hypothetical protein
MALRIGKAIQLYIAGVLGCLLLGGCGGDVTASADYQQACQGAPLKDQLAVYKAEADGYRINSRYRCIDLQSWQEVQQALERIAHARRPEVMAQHQAEADRAHAQRLQQIALRTNAREQALASAVPVPRHRVDANTASIEQLAAVCGVDGDGCARHRAGAPAGRTL